MKQYIYTGPLSGVSLKGNGDIMLHPGSEVKMPEEHPYTQRLIKRGWLQEIPAKQSKSVKEENSGS